LRSSDLGSGIARPNAIRVDEKIEELAMGAIEREFYRSWRGPKADDMDRWRLVFDRKSGTLTVRHEWKAERHNGADELGIAEFLVQQGEPQTALLRLLFGDVTAEMSQSATR
jgi:hypothetical protein